MPTIGGSESDLVLFVERSSELLYMARLSAIKACSRSESEYKSANKSYVIDPKPGDLSMVRMKQE